MKKALLVLLVVLVCASVAFAGGNKEKAAAGNKVLRMLTWTGYAPESQIDEFFRLYGIKVEATPSSNEEMISKLRATGGSGFDLAQPSQDRIVAVVQEFGIYQPIDFSKVNEDQLDQSILSATKKYTEYKGKSYAVPHVFGTSGLVVNKKYVKKDPKELDYKDLLDPKYAGHVSYRCKRPILCAMGFSLGYDPFALYNNPTEYQKMLDAVGAKLIDGKKVLKYYWENGDQLLQGMQSGEIWIAKGWEQGAWKLYKENPDIDYVAPKSGAMAFVDTFAIPSKSENVDGAYKWINFVLQPEKAAEFTNVEGYGTASKDAVKYYTPEAAANFSRCFTPEVMANMNWYPTVPSGLEEMEGKVLDKMRAAK
jgi:spermidine/putrescine transport system substrate-binding protein